MNAVRVYEGGGPEQLIYEDVETPKVISGWSLVRVKGFGINHSEIFTRRGLSPSVKFPRILGIECVGEIAETSDARRFKPGMQVVSIMGEMGRDFDGSYAEYVLLPNEQIYPISSDLPWDELAALPETYYTAFGSLENLRIEDGMKVLVRGATSGVGLAFCKLLKGAGMRGELFGSCRNLQKEDRLKEYGFDNIILDKDGMLETSERFDRILELIGPFTLKDSFLHTKEHGIVCSTGQLGNEWYLNDFDPIMDLPANGYLTSFYSGNVDGERLQKMLDYVKAHHIDAKPQKVFKLHQIQEAHRYLEGSESFGKVVVLT